MYKLLSIVFLLSGCSTIQTKCPGSMGIMYDTINDLNIVYSVYTNSPASKIGIESGDVLLNVFDLKGNPGDQVLVKWEHNNKVHSKYTTLMCRKQYD